MRRTCVFVQALIKEIGCRLKSNVYQYLFSGVIHYAIAKVLGPFIWGRGFCGWACWTAAILDWLPIKENRPIPQKYTYIRIPVFILSLLIPYLVLASGYDYMHHHVNPQFGKWHQFIWFLVGNGIYYLTAIPLAFIFHKRRAFCKIACPVSLVMKAQTKVAMIKRKPTGNACTACGLCNKHCPMDIDVMSYIQAGKPIRSSECILCHMCEHVCPVQAIT